MALEDRKVVADPQGHPVYLDLRDKREEWEPMDRLVLVALPDLLVLPEIEVRQVFLGPLDPWELEVLRDHRVKEEIPADWAKKAHLDLP